MSFDCCQSTYLTVKKIILIIISFPLKVKAAAKYVDVPVSIFLFAFKNSVCVCVYNSFLNNYGLPKVYFRSLKQ